MVDQEEKKFARARELIDEIEADVRKALTSRERAYGLWTCAREKLEAFLRPWCFTTPLKGREFDEMVYGFLLRYTSTDLRPIVDRPSRGRRRTTAPKLHEAETFVETMISPHDMPASSVAAHRSDSANDRRDMDGSTVDAEAVPSAGRLAAAGRRLFSLGE